MTKKKVSAQDVMQPHSVAKVEFYIKYLERYLSVLCKSKHFDTINIIDVFCGRGQYADGKFGSSIRAFQTIQNIQDLGGKRIGLWLNDRNTTYTDYIQAYIAQQQEQSPARCEVHYANSDAEELLDKMVYRLKKSDKTHNLLFIDPYGYKYIHKDTIEGLMANGHTEIILFLPISFMHRFSGFAITKEDNNAVAPLKDFVNSFFPKDHPIRIGESLTIFEYIQELTNALNFGGKYYATSYHIQRDHGTYFALFFISANLLGFEKIMEVKWSLDEEDGNGFQLPENQLSLFADEFKHEGQTKKYNELRHTLCTYLKEPHTNGEIYEFTLRNGFLSKHAYSILKELEQQGKLDVESLNGSKIRKGAFYINYDGYNKPSLKTSLKR